MRPWGKIIGLIMGLMLAPILKFFGPLLGLWLGHKFDRALANLFKKHRRRSYTHLWNPTFIQHCFSLLGAIAKADTVVKQASIDAIERFLASQKFNKTQRSIAIAAFNEGKTASFHLEYCCQQLKLYFLFHPQAKVLLLTAVQQVGQAVNPISMTKVQILNYVHAQFSESVFEEQRFHWQGWNQWEHAHAPQTPKRPEHNTGWAHAILGSTHNDNLATITKKYRKLLSQNHPDRIKNPTPEKIKQANEKTYEIKKAYELLKQQL